MGGSGDSSSSSSGNTSSAKKTASTETGTTTNEEPSESNVTLLCRDSTLTSKMNCMLYCRVLLGNPYFTNTTLAGRRPIDPKKFDSVIGVSCATHMKHTAQQKHREFVVYSRYQIYPEYVISYTTSKPN